MSRIAPLTFQSSASTSKFPNLRAGAAVLGRTLGRVRKHIQEHEGLNLPSTATGLAAPAVYTLQQANAMLPMLRDMMGQLQDLTACVQRDEPQLQFFANRRPTLGRSCVDEEFEEVHASLRQQREQWQSHLDELRAWGIEVDPDDPTHMDLPGQISGKTVRWCWSIDEPIISSYHDAGQPCSRRRPI